MDLTITSSVNFCQKQKLNMLICPITPVPCLGRGKFLLRFFELMDEIEFFLNKNHLQPLMQNTEWLFKISFREDLITFHNEFNPKLKGKTVFCKLYTVVKSC